MRTEKIVFWVLMLAIIGIVIWLAFGSPDFENGVLAIILFFVASEILLWKALFAVDRRASLGFERVKSGFKEFKDRLGGMEDRLEDIELSIKKMRRK